MGGWLFNMLNRFSDGSAYDKRCRAGDGSIATVGLLDIGRGGNGYCTEERFKETACGVIGISCSENKGNAVKCYRGNVDDRLKDVCDRSVIGGDYFFVSTVFYNKGIGELSAIGYSGGAEGFND